MVQTGSAIPGPSGLEYESRALAGGSRRRCPGDGQLLILSMQGIRAVTSFSILSRSSTMCCWTLIARCCTSPHRRRHMPSIGQGRWCGNRLVLNGYDAQLEGIVDNVLDPLGSYPETLGPLLTSRQTLQTPPLSLLRQMDAVDDGGQRLKANELPRLARRIRRQPDRRH